MEKVQNLLSFSDFEKNWKAKEPKKTKRTEVALDVVEKKKIQDEFIEDDDLIEDDEILDDEDLVEDEAEDSGWQEQIRNLIVSIIEEGEEPEEVIEYVEHLAEELEDEYGVAEEGEEGEEIDEDEILDDEEVADDEEGEEIEESVKNFKNWKK